MNMNRLMKIAFMAMLLINGATNGFAKRGFAIVIDSKSLKEARNEIRAYQQAIEERQGLKVYLVVDKWGVPDSIRACLKSMYLQKKDPIEGAVLIGDIPIAMIRDAQHMTSAFKMDQRRKKEYSSVPTDRYYDDFGLQFAYIGKDKDRPYFYYSLKPESRQYVFSDIYTGRIRPTDANGISRYQKLRSYLTKATKAKYQTNKMDQMLFFSGHGYISESNEARIDEKQGLYEHFPWLRQQHKGIGYIDHSQQDVSKFLLMNEMQRKNLDLAILHHHGGPETQYLDATPKIQSPEAACEMIKNYCRGYIKKRVQKNETGTEKEDSVKNVLMERFDIPKSWLSNTFDEKTVAEDSTYAANQDLTTEDFKKYDYTPNCKVVMLDACFNGSFHLDDCIASEYIFNEGETVTCIANSVNVLQDKWSDRYIGLLGLGAFVGNIPRFSGYLESQCLGDPTFQFAPSAIKWNVNDLLASNDWKKWKKFVGNTSLPDLQALAIDELTVAGKITSDQLLRIFKTSKYAQVRLQALFSLAEERDGNFIEALKSGADDSHEMIQRFALNFIGKNGSPELTSTLVKKAIENNLSPRCKLSTFNAMTMYPQKDLMKEFNRQFSEKGINYVEKEKVRKDIERRISIASNKWLENIDEICNEKTTEKRRRSDIRTSRNYTPPYLVEKLMAYFKTCRNPETQKMIMESLGWRRYSYMAPEIKKFAHECYQDGNLDESVRNEALKTYNRIK